MAPGGAFVVSLLMWRQLGGVHALLKRLKLLHLRALAY